MTDDLAELRAGLESPDAATRIAAVRRLAWATHLDIVPLLCAALEDPVLGVRQSAAEALEQVGDARAVRPLMAAARDTVGYIRELAAGALRRIGDPQTLALLSELLTDANPRIRLHAAEGIHGLLARAPREGLDPDPELASRLAALLVGEDPAICRAAARALGCLASPDAVEPLCAAVDFWLARTGPLRPDEYPTTDELEGGARVLQALTEALGSAPDPRSIPRLCRLLGVLWCRVPAASALSRLAVLEPMPELRDALPALRELVAPWAFFTPAELKAAAREAIRNIERALVLPRPGQAPAADPHNLPRPTPRAEDAG